MRLYYLMAALLICVASTSAQVRIGNTSDPHKGAVLDLQSTETDGKGMLFPRVNLLDVNKFQLDGTPTEGMTIYNTNETIGKGLFIWNGSQWINEYSGLTPTSIESGKYVSNSGMIVSTEAAGRAMVRYPVNANKQYILECTAVGPDAATITFWNGDEFLGGLLPGDMTRKKVKFSPPYENATEVIISPDIARSYSLSESSYMEIKQNGNMPLTFKPQIRNNALPIKKAGETIKILFIGSSWGEDTYYLVPKVFAASGINAIIGGCLIPGGTFQMYVDAWRKNTHIQFRYSEYGADWIEAQVPFAHALVEKQDWDIIVFQQNAADSFYWERYQPGMASLLEILKMNVLNRKVCFALNQTWTPAPDHMAEYGFDNQRKMYEASLEANNNAAQATGVDVIIPCGMAVYALRSTSKNTMNDLTWDGIHLDQGVGRYLTACTVFETLIAPIYGVNVYGNTFRTENPYTNHYVGTAVTNDNAPIIQYCAIMANANRYGFPNASHL